MQRRALLILGISCFVFSAFEIPTAAHEQMEMKPTAIRWQPMPHDWANGPPPPPGAKNPPEIALIWGDPTKEDAPFIFWMRPAERGTNVPVPPHWHPTDENIVVLSGVFCIGEGDKYDESTCQDMPQGTTITMPKMMHHFGVSKDATVEIYGIGPFKINWVK